jgi:hypothetical protein
VGASPWPGRCWPRSAAMWPSGRGVCGAGNWATRGERAGSGAMDGVWRKAVVSLDRPGVHLSTRRAPDLRNCSFLGIGCRPGPFLTPPLPQGPPLRWPHKMAKPGTSAVLSAEEETCPSW